LAVVIGILVCKAVKRSAMRRRDGPVPGMVRLAVWHPDRAGTALWPERRLGAGAPQVDMTGD